VFVSIFAPQQKEDRTMPIDFDSLLALARRTKRYSICDSQPGEFEVIDDRYLLDRLLQFPELRPTTNDLIHIQIEFADYLQALSSGPTLSLGDSVMLGYLMMTVEGLDPNGENTAYNAAYKGAVFFSGTVKQVEDFLNAALNHRVQPALNHGVLQ
jgi:hypothetical protein